ncbi:MAG: type II and III secretion system protein, partial [Chthoniobacterales bacterium]
TAFKRYEQVLNIDPYNIAARKGEEQVNLARSHYSQSAYNETRSRMLWQVLDGWQLPVKKFTNKSTIDNHKTDYDPGTAKITAKLNRIIIPKVDLRDVTIHEAVDYLRNQSRVLDTDDQAQKRGVNIVLILPQPNISATGASSPTVETAPAIGPTVTTPQVQGTTPIASSAPVPTTTTEDTRVTLSLNNIPLYEALKYLARATDMKVKVEPYAVKIVPQTEATESLIQRTFKVPAGFIPTQSSASGPSPFAATAGRPSTTTDDGPKLPGRPNAREYLESQQIPFPPGTSATYNPSNSTLTIRNTPSNMDVIEVLVDEAWRGAPQQIQIESKFVEINQNNLKELGFDWLLGPFSINSSGTFGNGGTAGAGTSISSNDYPILSPGGNPIGQNPVTGGLQTGAQAITPTTIEGVIAQQANLIGGGSIGPGPGIFSFAGVYTNPQFQVVIRALNQKTGVDLMSAPMVTTKSGQRAVIHLIQEFRYPSTFTPPTIPQSTGGGGGTGVSAPFVSTAIITPTTPSQFVVKNTGVSLEVDPAVASDGYTIDMNITPEVVDFDGFINYGTPILGITIKNVLGIQVPQTVTLSSNTINQPIFSVRKVVTSVSIYDGQTVALGGLIREDVQKVQDKVPFLGDIPLAGRLFRSDVDQRTKKNLVVFVTARLVDAQGNFLRNTEEEEDTVTPIGVPEDLPKPQTTVIRGK